MRVDTKGEREKIARISTIPDIRASLLGVLNLIELLQSQQGDPSLLQMNRKQVSPKRWKEGDEE